LRGANESASPKLEELGRIMKDLCIRAHNLWISWLSDELSAILARDLGKDDGLSATTPLRVCGVCLTIYLSLLIFCLKYSLYLC
jgi:hypothetical protein